MITIFIFRRDLRLDDNIGLLYAINNFKNIVPIFIFTPEQITDKNKYKSDNSIQFMLESLDDLNINLKKYNSKLHTFYGDNIEVLTKINKMYEIENIVYNIDYTPYAKKRDKQIKDFCLKNEINNYELEDYLLMKMGTLNKKDGSFYSVFTPFRNNAYKHYKEIDRPIKIKIKDKELIKLKNHKNYKIEIEKNENKLVIGGRKEGLKMLNLAIVKQKDYNKNHNNLSIETSLLSAYIKFGCVSIREVFWRIYDNYKLKNNLTSQLIWREFYYYIVYYNPDILLKHKCFNPKYEDLNWSYDKNLFNKWKNGLTGFPIVDAGMRQMNETGYMHNRARLITSNFLNRMLNLDWRMGEQYFAQKLTDYDVVINNGNWQWIASCGTDTKPFNQRTFNPWLQSNKYDKNCEYIKKWIPELKDVPSNKIHKWYKYCDEYKNVYIKPIVDYNEAKKLSIKIFEMK